MSNNNYLKRTQLFVSTHITPKTTYTTTLAPSQQSTNDPSKRVMTVTFTRPTASNPVPQHSCKIYVYVTSVGVDYHVTGYKVEGKTLVMKETFGFEEGWVDRVVREKEMICGIVSAGSGGDGEGDSGRFIKTRLVEERKDL